MTSLTYNTSGGATLGTLTYTYDAYERWTGVSGGFATTSIPAAQTLTYDNDNSLATMAAFPSTTTGNIIGMTGSVPAVMQL